MELKDISTTVLTFMVVGILLAVGIITLVRLSDTARVPTSVVNETIAITAGLGQVAHGTDGGGYVTSVTFFANGSDVYILNNESASTLLNFTPTGHIFFGTGATHNFNISYTYDAATGASSSIQETANNTDDFVPWFAVIVLMVVAAVVLSLIVLFKQ